MNLPSLRNRRVIIALSSIAMASVDSFIPVSSATDADKIADEANSWSHIGFTSDHKPADHPPEDSNKRYLITSALPYVNNVPHLGNIIGSVLSADVFSRFCRLRGRTSLYISGTDEYGTATETKALEEKTTPQEICKKYHEIHSDIYKWFNISFDHFGRTSTDQQTKICQDIFWKLYNKGFIFEDSVEQLFCESCSRFLADRFVEGICPFCQFADARGDQCDSCSKLINAPELIEPKCKVCKSRPVVKTSKHLFLDLPKLEPRIKEWFKRTTESADSCWTTTAKAIASSWLKDGLKARCITRDLKWGTKVPLDGFEDKVFYVWFDAPIGYFSITNCMTEDWEDWWKRPDEVELWQFMAKDNVPFHGIIMPASCLGADDNFVIVKNLIAVEYLNYEDSKFSKSRGVGVFGTDAKETGIPSDVWRFYLLYIRPETQDSSFSWSDLHLKYDKELNNNFGNFIFRSLSFIFKNFDGTIQDCCLTEDDKTLIKNVNAEVDKYLAKMEKAEMKESIKALLTISSLGNGYIQANKPWELIKKTDDDRSVLLNNRPSTKSIFYYYSNRRRAGSIMSLSANITALLSILFSPFIPESCQTLRQQLNLNEEQFKGKYLEKLLTPGHKINEPTVLFKRIEAKQIEDLKKKFAGAGTASNGPQVVKHEPLSEILSADEIQKMIEDQGNKVRSLKAAKSEKAIIESEVSRLKFLKEAHVAKLKQSSQP